jgi:hypothetical protein
VVQNTLNQQQNVLNQQSNAIYNNLNLALDAEGVGSYAQYNQNATGPQRLIRAPREQRLALPDLGGPIIEEIPSNQVALRPGGEMEAQRGLEPSQKKRKRQQAITDGGGSSSRTKGKGKAPLREIQGSSSGL